MVPNYIGSSTLEVTGVSDPEYATVYNGSGSTYSAGAIKVLVPKWISGKGVVNTLAAPATNDAAANRICIVIADIADGAYGRVLTRGVYGDGSSFGAATSGAPAANAYLEVLNGGTAFTDAGAVGGAVVPTEACAIKIANVTTNVDQIYLLGRLHSIKGS